MLSVPWEQLSNIWQHYKNCIKIVSNNPETKHFQLQLKYMHHATYLVMKGTGQNMDKGNKCSPVTVGVAKEPWLVVEVILGIGIERMTPALVPTQRRSLQTNRAVMRKQAALCCRMISSAALDQSIFLKFSLQINQYNYSLMEILKKESNFCQINLWCLGCFFFVRNKIVKFIKREIKTIKKKRLFCIILTNLMFISL